MCSTAWHRMAIRNRGDSLKPRILYFDTERAPPLAWVWEDNKPQFINYTQYVQHGFFTSIQWQFSDENKPSALSVTDSPTAFRKNPTCDKRVVKKAAELLNSADIVVAHNGKRFDWKHVLGKMVYHGIDPIRKPYIIDTLLEAKKAKFPSNALGNLADYLEIAKKEKNQANIGKMVFGSIDERISEIDKQTAYGLKDIQPMIEFYEKIRPYMETHPNIGAYTGILTCSCGSTDLHSRGERHLSGNRVKAMYRCRECSKPMYGHVISKAAKI